ncbi:MAG TPA: AAA family ATPase [Ottowia sp.]|nr:AAA family ATPase [Ottowia sp.]
MTARRRSGPAVTAPPAGTRLNLGSVAAALKVTVTELSAALGLPRTTVYRLLMNEWPARAKPAEITALRQRIESLLADNGATDVQLAVLWHAHTHSSRLPSGQTHVDCYGRPLDHVPAKPTTPTKEEEPEMLLPKQTLTPQARRHFKLFTNPFDGEVLKDEQFFDGGDMRYVREQAWQCSQLGGFVAIVGESGAGKTTVQADLEARLQADSRGVIVIKPSVLGMEESSANGHKIKATDILHAIITTLQPEAAVPQTLQARTVRAAKMLAASAEAGAQHLLVIEEAHGLPDATLKHLKRLHELRQGRRSLLGILLLAQPELKMRLANGLRTGTLREVAQRIEMVELLPLDADLQAYLRCRAEAAGAKLPDLVDDGAVEQLRTRLTRKTSNGAVSMCYPLAVNNMLTRALNTAAELGVPTVSRDVIAAI